MASVIITESAPKRMKRLAVAAEIRDRLQSECGPTEEPPAITTIEDALKGLFR